MKTFSRILKFLAVLCACTASADETQLYIFKASAVVPVTYISTNPATFVDKVVTKTLSAKDLINLTLGRALGTAIDAKKEVLALAAGLGDTPTHRVIIYDPSAAAPADRIKATIVTLNTLDYDKAFLGTNLKGFGIATATLHKTVAGDPAKFGFPSDVILCGSATGTQVRGDPFVYDVPKIAFTLNGINARLSFTNTVKDANDADVTTTITGIVLKGTFSAGGKRLDVLPVPPP